MKPKILMLDIETAPHKVYAWGLWDQNISINQIEEPGYTLCWAAKWLGKKKIYFDSIHTSLTVDMLNGIHTLVDAADAVVHYNGTKFDMPTLNHEFLKYDILPPAPYKQIDLLRIVRKQFRLPSNKLDYVAQYLDVGQKLQHKGMPLWRDCMAGDPIAWKEMRRYNIQDVLLLEKVYNRLLPWIYDSLNMGLFVEEGKDRVCPACGSTHLHKSDIARTKTMIYQRYRCMDCGAYPRERKNMTPKHIKENVLVLS